MKHPSDRDASKATAVMWQNQQVADGETMETGRDSGSGEPGGRVAAPGPFEIGFLLGILVGEGHFGGDGRQPEVTLRMHTRHEKLFRWLQAHFPGGRLYGPYHHGGRSYYQWMARGQYLRQHLAPIIGARLEEVDAYAAERFRKMCGDYGIDAKD